MKNWKTTKTYFSNKGLDSSKLLLKEECHIISDKEEENKYLTGK